MLPMKEVSVFEPALPLHKVVPMWVLPRVGSDATFGLSRPRGVAHTVLVVTRTTEVAPWLALLAPSLTALQALPARGVVVWALPALAATAPAPWLAVQDAEGRVAGRYLPDQAMIGVFALDRYNDLYHQWLVATPAELPDAAAVAEWIEAVGRQCSI